MIAVALYFGLRAQNRAPVPSVPSEVGSAQPSAVPVTATTEDLQALVGAALESHRPNLRARCLPEGTTARFTFELTFAADGRQLGRGVQAHRDAGSAEVTSCVLEHLPPLRLRPIGRKMSTRVAFALP